MNSSKYFVENKNNIGYVSSNFKANFMDMDFTIPKKIDMNNAIKI